MMTLQEARRLRVGMIVYLRSYPIDWLFAGISEATPLRVEKLGPKNAVVSRVDGGQFPIGDSRYTFRIVERGGTIDIDLPTLHSEPTPHSDRVRILRTELRLH